MVGGKEGRDIGLGDHLTETPAGSAASTGARRCEPARSESLLRGAVCGSPARTDLWEPGAGNPPRPPGDRGGRQPAPCLATHDAPALLSDSVPKAANLSASVATTRVDGRRVGARIRTLLASGTMTLRGSRVRRGV